MIPGGLNLKHFLGLPVISHLCLRVPASSWETSCITETQNLMSCPRFEILAGLLCTASPSGVLRTIVQKITEFDSREDYKILGPTGF